MIKNYGFYRLNGDLNHDLAAKAADYYGRRWLILLREIRNEVAKSVLLEKSLKSVLSVV